MGRRNVHRHYYPNAKQGQDPREVQPIIKADPIVTPEGVKLDFATKDAVLTPSDLVSLARWLYSLSHEAEDLAQAGRITATQGYNVQEGISVPVPR